MYCTRENASVYVGRTLNVNERNGCHYYPLRIVERFGSYWYIDRHNTMMKVPGAKDFGGGLYFDYDEPTEVNA